MSRHALFVTVAIIVLMIVSPVARAAEIAPIRITSPADGATITLGESVLVEVALGPSLKGSPFSLRLDGKSVWIGQKSYAKSFDTTEWGEGRHALQATVFRDEEETTSPVVWVEVVAPVPAGTVRSGAPAEPEMTGSAVPAVGYEEPSAPPASEGGFALPFTDGFEDEDLDSSRWLPNVPTTGLEIRESDRELRVFGTVSTADTGGAQAALKAFFNEPVDCSVWFREEELGCFASTAALSIQSESGGVQLSYFAVGGYVLTSTSQPNQPRTARAFGDETSEWHQLRLTYDPREGFAEGFVDGTTMGTVPTSIEGFVVGIGVYVQQVENCFVDVRFDDFEVKRPGESAEELPPPAEILDDEPQWERDPWLGVDDPVVPGQVVERRTPYGDYFEYVPFNVADPARVVVVVHGSPGDDNLALERSRVSARSAINEKGWLLLADTKGVIIVSPSFDRDRFYGYRYLQGAPIGADELVLQIVDSFAEEYPSSDGKLYVFGHSAGGQFANRFLVAHPDRVLAAVISSAGTFAYPDDTVDWPFGRRNSPNPEGFLQATQLPVRVIVGSEDDEDISYMGEYQRGSTHLERAESWVEAMRELAWENDLEANIEYIVVPGARHSAWALDISSVWWLADVIDATSGQ